MISEGYAGVSLLPELKVLSKRDCFIDPRIGPDDLVWEKAFRTRRRETWPLVTLSFAVLV